MLLVGIVDALQNDPRQILRGELHLLHHVLHLCHRRIQSLVGPFYRFVPDCLDGNYSNSYEQDKKEDGRSHYDIEAELRGKIAVFQLHKAIVLLCLRILEKT